MDVDDVAAVATATGADIVLDVVVDGGCVTGLAVPLDLNGILPRVVRRHGVAGEALLTLFRDQVVVSVDVVSGGMAFRAISERKV